MSSTPERLNLKLERAEKHILDLEAAFKFFLNSDSYEIGFNDNAEEKKRIYYLVKADAVPLECSLIAGDAIHNLRSALDHVAHHLVAVGSGNNGPFAHAYFPIFKDAASYMAGRERKIKGMRDEAIQAIDAIEPYAGGLGEILWHLNCLDIIDKHRLLLAVVGYVRGHSLLPSQRQEIITGYLGSYPGGTPPDLSKVIGPPVIKTSGLKAGDVIAAVPHSELDQEMQFLLDITFGEPQIVKGKPVMETLKAMTDFIKVMILRAFDQDGLL